MGCLVKVDERRSLRAFRRAGLDKSRVEAKRAENRPFISTTLPYCWLDSGIASHSSDRDDDEAGENKVVVG